MARRATWGMDQIEWVIGDEQVVREEEAGQFSERVIRLPKCYLAFNVDYDAPPIVPSPCLRNQHLTYGSLVSQYKISPQVLDTWSEILTRASASHLVLANRAMGSESNRDFMLGELRRRGVDQPEFDVSHLPLIASS